MTSEAIGGYFELEIPKGREFHIDAIRLNSGRHSLEYILNAKLYTKIYIPYYTCDVLIEPIKRLQIDFSYYSIDENLRPILDFEKIENNAVLLYTNYFGICNNQVKEIAARGCNLIIDNAQSFFSKPEKDIDTFYSARKFFGVPDGAYLYTDKQLDEDFEKETSLTKTGHLLKRIELGPEAGYSDFKASNHEFKNVPIRQLSNLSQRLLQGVDYSKVMLKRNENFSFLHEQLNLKNKLSFEAKNLNGPMVYPFMTDQKGIRQKLISNKIYVPIYWPNVLNEVETDSWEYQLTDQIIPLPIDQRYEITDMIKILELI